MDGQEVRTDRTAPAELSPLVVTLLKGVIYREDRPALWDSLLRLQAHVADYVAVLGLKLELDEAEGYAFLRSRPQTSEEQGTENGALAAPDAPGDAGAPGREPVPRLVVRRQLSYPVSLMLALLRKKLAEFDAEGSETRLVLSREQVVDLVRIFLPERGNEVKLVGQIDSTLEKIEDLGFIRRLKGQTNMIEVRRILKAFVDAQWLADFDERLAEYQKIAMEQTGEKNRA